MEIIDYIIGAALVFFLVWRFMPTKGITQASISELKEILKNKDCQFIDVRTPTEFNQYKIKEFKNIPLNELGNKFNSLDLNKPVVVICQSGMRSTTAAKLLKRKGFTNIINVRGGMVKWRG